MNHYGINDIHIANQIIGEMKIKRLSQLSHRCKIKVSVDSREGIDQLEDYFDNPEYRLPVLIEVDTGMNRCGIRSASDAIEMVKRIERSAKICFHGIASHSGNIYQTESREGVLKVAAEEVAIMLRIANKIRSEGIHVQVISIGSTPAALYIENMKGITEFRPGNYVFNDRIQVSLGVAKIEDCALSIIATVISKPAVGRIIIDAGSKCLGLDRGVHGNQLLTGFGYIKEYPRAVIERLSEEHGIIQIPDYLSIEIGDRITIIPNHACSVTNLFDFAYVVKDQQVIDRWQIIARGKVT